MDTTLIHKVRGRDVRLLFFAVLFILSSALRADDLTHSVQNGETVYAIARRYGVKVEDILVLNGINDVRKIHVGQKIRIPTLSLMAQPIETGAATKHKTLKGETLMGIARTYNVTLQSLMRENKLREGYVLKTGDVLIIPAKAGEAPAAAHTPASPAFVDTRPAAARSSPNVKWPVNAKESAYISGKLNPGMVLTGEKSEPVHSVSSGTVVSAGPYRGFGWVVIVKSDDGYDYFYGGCEKVSVRKGDRVVPGVEVGRLGVSALTAKPELTFMVYHKRKSIDPALAPRA
ncbi:MAG: M23 family metallopeptidase [Spirochaetaceae bacterium]|nr:M23 family metallopeptidase [Spirochaetaceae bacterium]